MWIKAKFHNSGAPTIIRVNPFLKGNAIARGVFLTRYRSPGYRFEHLRVYPHHPASLREQLEKIRANWRKWLVMRAIQAIDSISLSMTLMANDYGDKSDVRDNHSLLASIESLLIAWFKRQRARVARATIRWWQRLEDSMVDDLYTTR